MKKLQIIVTAIFFIFFSCSEHKQEEADIFVLQGRVLNPKEASISLQTSDDIYFSKFDESGRFAFEIPTKQPVFYRLQLGELGLPMYAEPGNADSVLCESTFKNGLRIEGQNAEINQYLLDKVKRIDRMQQDARSFYVCSSAEFTQKLDSFFSELSAQVEKMHGASGQFRMLENIELQCKYAEFLLSYEGANKYFLKTDSVPLHASFFHKMEEIDVNNSTFLPSTQFRSFLHKLLSNQSKDYIDQQPGLADKYNRYYIAKLSVIDNLFSNQKIKDRVAYELMKKRLKNHEDRGVDTVMMLFEKVCQSADFKSDIKTLYEDWNLIQPGKPAPDFSCKNAQGKVFTLESFKGQNLCIDVWASWCKPCIEQFEALKALDEQFPDVTFIGISVDERMDLWANICQKFDFENVQLICENGWDSKFRKDYRIKTIPRLILIDKEGNIFNVDAPLPKNGLKNELEKLLAK
jgi:peroxiredoxin